MKVLLDTNIVIHRETNKVVRSDIGILFRWLDSLHHQKCIHPLTIQEISGYKDEDVVRTFNTKLSSYYVLKTTAPDTAKIAEIKATRDKTVNDVNDSSLLNELAQNRVDLLITEDRNIHRKARLIGLSSHVFTIDGFLEKATAENPELADYRVLSVKKEYFGNINLKDTFFDSFRQDYPGFDIWFNRKADEVAYYCADDQDNVVAFLYLKVEGADEDHREITPALTPARRLKIGTFKVISNGYKIGERFIKVIFDNAIRFTVDEIYVTIFDHSDNHTRLIQLLQDWGFVPHGTKNGIAGEEKVLVRPCTAKYAGTQTQPRRVYPYIRPDTQKWIVSIYPEYHTDLFPDSVLNTESPADFVENAPNRNALSKVYTCRSVNRDLKPSDVVVFYRTASGGSAWRTAVTTTLGVVQEVITDIKDQQHFIELCRRRSVFSDQKLAELWNYDPRNRPFVVNFLYIYSFPKRMNRQALIEGGIISNTSIRGFEPMTNEQFDLLLGGSRVDRRLIVD
ncbi:PIN domain-containing protein [Chitinolyticbacter meiyuanensis]|uniref:PIN domain-containing protein n=1 Tax=Chitinolyticbacter meiyuanensis TaxID=682798 RepID=UPI0011E5C05B|nr:PIN domain-containing protein [Chitinolyticbacter meiyuanensis]